MQKIAEKDEYYPISRLERKLVFPPENAAFILAWLRHSCIPDPTFPVNCISSLYYDTLELDAYHECLNGDIYKNKVRLRWYDLPSDEHDITAYIEVKSKNGFNTFKQRRPINIAASYVATGNHQHIQPELNKVLPELGYEEPNRLHPMIIISYRRHRYREPLRGTSITCDTHISSTMAREIGTPWSSTLEVPATILEIKGTDMSVPPVLNGLESIGPCWSAFSKYAKCLESHFGKPGSNDWLKP